MLESLRMGKKGFSGCIITVKVKTYIESFSTGQRVHSVPLFHQLTAERAIPRCYVTLGHMVSIIQPRPLQCKFAGLMYTRNRI